MHDDDDDTVRLSARSRAERALLIFSGDGAREVKLPAAGVITIGRAPTCDVVLAHPSVSREHLRIVLTTSAFVEDLGAVNATRVGGVPLRPNQRVPLAAGVLVDIGAMAIMLRVGETGAVSGDAKEHGDAASRGGVAGADRSELERYAKSSLTILIQGETGAGKEVMAEMLHALSPRAGRPLLRLNCAALPDTLMESELFGHERGAFTGAVADKPGLLETAEGGTVLLDEIGDMSPFLQAKLLRVLEERKVWRVGALKARAIDVRFLAATHRDLAELVASGGFRRDLFFRLNAITLRVAPLRERRDEIASLAVSFAEEAATASGASRPMLAAGALDALSAYPWPGNVRELRNVMGRAVASSDGATIEARHLGLDVPPRESVSSSAPIAMPASPDSGLHAAVDALEERRIVDALRACGFNRTKTAQKLGIARNTLAARMARFGIRVPESDSDP